jgi:hypothetical protein
MPDSFAARLALFREPTAAARTREVCMRGAGAGARGGSESWGPGGVGGDSTGGAVLCQVRRSTGVTLQVCGVRHSLLRRDLEDQRQSRQ